MMRFDPTLIVTRLVVERREHVAYDEVFHEGVNVIRGENSSGKSTILNCIYYGLGGDLSDWSETALLCTKVIIEVRLNGSLATLSREISSQTGQGMEIYGGSFEDAQKAPRGEWKKYPYRRSPNQESFSQSLFRLLGIPEVANDVSGNLTIHQILRLLYSDQLSPVETLFRYDTRFDPPSIRDAVGRLLCGAYDNRLYQNEVRIRELIREFDTASAELKSLFAVIGKTDHSLTTDWLEGERRNLTEAQEKLQNEIEAVERELFTSVDADELTLNEQQAAYSEVQRLQTSLGKVRLDRDTLLMSEADSALFVRALEQKIASLRDASSVSEHLGDVHFTVCPACLAPTPDISDEVTCHLCKTPFERGNAQERIVAIINDAAIQLKQSRTLQERRRERIIQLENELHALQALWREASTRLASTQRLPSTTAREQLRSLNRQSGYLQRQIEDLEKQEQLVKLIDAAAARKNSLNDEITTLKTENEVLKTAQERQFSLAKTLIAEEIKMLLRNDLRRQDSFENPQSVDFDFSSNSITVDGHTYFSASSRVILKSSFFLGFMSAATKDPLFRHPRFVMIDTIEDKGMEPERSHNFQNLILMVSEKAKVEHQIIYATAMISPKLDEEQHLIGRFYTRDEPTLAMVS